MKNDIYSHLDSIENNIFFSTYTYKDLKNKINEFKLDEFFYQKISSKDLLIFSAHFFKTIIENRIPVIISPNLGEYEVKKIESHIDFNDKEGKCFFNSSNVQNPFILFSSGTTGDRNGIVHEFNSIKKHCDSFNQIFPIFKNEIFTQMILPYSVGGFMAVMRAIYRGAKIDFEISNDTNFISIVPTQISKLLDFYRFRVKKTNINRVLIGGAEIPPNIKNELINLQIPFYSTYGMTETLSFVMLNGKPILNVQVKINQTDNTLELNSQCLFKGKMTHKKFVPFTQVFYNTRDQVKVLNDLIIILGRTDDTINSGGIKINLSELKNKITEENNTSVFFLFGIKNDYWGESLSLFFPDNSTVPNYKNLLHYEIPKFSYSRPISFFEQKPSKKTLHFELYSSLFDYRYIDNKMNHTLVFFHGFMENYLEWESILKKSISSSNILLINLPGHGNSDVSSFKHSKEYLALLKEFVQFYIKDEEDIELSFAGYSMGGRIALNLSYFFPGSKLYLISTSIGLKEEEIKKREALDSTRFQTIKSENDFYQFLKTWYENPIFGDFKKESYFEDYIKSKSLKDFSKYQNSLNLLGPSKLNNFETSLLKIKETSPDLTFITGEKDTKYLDEINSLINEKFKLKIFSIKNASHKLHYTHQNELISLLKTLF